MAGQAAMMSVSLSDYIEAKGWTSAQKLVLLLGALAFMCAGFASAIIGVAAPAILADMKLDSSAFASIAAIGLAGVAIGSVLGGAIGDRTP